MGEDIDRTWRNDKSLRWCLVAVLNMINILILRYLLSSAGEQVETCRQNGEGESLVPSSVLRNQVPTQQQAGGLLGLKTFMKRVNTLEMLTTQPCPYSYRQYLEG